MGQDSTKLQSKRRVENAEKVELLSKENKATVKLSATEVQTLKQLYHRLAALSPETEYIDKQTFLNYFPLEGVLAERLFATFDKDRNNVIDYEEFLGGLALCLCGSVDEKFQLVFDLYNIDDGDGISEDELAIVLKSTLMAATAIVTPIRNSPIGMRNQPFDIDKHVQHIVKDAFEECDTSQTGKLSPEEFRTWAEHHSYILDIIFGHRSFTDKQKISENITAATIKAAEMNSVRYQAQTWVDSSAISEQNPESRLGYTKAAYLWSPVFPVMLKAPKARSEHTVCVYQGSLYLLGGRGTSAYKDFWKYDLMLNNWSEIPRNGERPSQIFGHSMVLHKGSMFVYGGEFASCDTVVWKYTFACNEWRKISPASPCKKMLPGNRRHHSAVIYDSRMYVFGGIIDLRGSTNDLWSFSFVNHEWNLVSQTPKNNPGPRYEHSALVYNKAMWLFGGLENYQAKSDLWKWNFEDNNWSRIKSKGGPVPIHGHRAVKCGNAMNIFGGSVNGEQQNIIWKFEFGSQSWSVITPHGGVSPPARSAPAVIILSAFSLPMLPPKLVNSKPKSASGGAPQNIVAEELRPRSSPDVQCKENTSSFKARSRPWSMSTDSLYQPTITNCAYKRCSAGSINDFGENSVAAFTNVSYSGSTEEAHLSQTEVLNTQPLQCGELRSSELEENKDGEDDNINTKEGDCMNMNKAICENFELNPNVMSHPKEGLCIFLVGGKYCGNHEFFTKAVDIWRCDVTKRRKRSNKVTKINVKTAGTVTEVTGNRKESRDLNKTCCGTSIPLSTSNSPYNTSRKVFASTCRQEASESRNLAVSDDVCTNKAETYHGDLVITDLGFSNEPHLIEED